MTAIASTVKRLPSNTPSLATLVPDTGTGVHALLTWEW